MRRIFILLTAAAVALSSSFAMAADIPAPAPVYKAPVAVPVAYNWTGFYIGANAGGAWSTAKTDLTPTGVIAGTGPAVALAQTGITNLNSSSFTGGIQAGYNWQFGNWVAGIEADVNFFNLNNSSSVGPVTIPGNASTITSESTRATWLATFRPRIGFVFDRSLLYATGGLAVGHVNYAQTINFFTIPDQNSGTVSQTRAGWAVGGGWEYLLTPNWTVKAEYLYADLGRLQFSTVNTLNTVVTYDHSERFTVQIGRVGLNYKF